MGLTNEKLLLVLVTISFPLLNYNFRILLSLIIVYLIFFPESKTKLLDNLGYNEIKEANKIQNPKSNFLYQKGTKELELNLGQLKPFLKTKTQFILIEDTWKQIIDLSRMILDNPDITYPHHHFDTFQKQKNLMIKSISELIPQTPSIHLFETTLTKDRTLFLDQIVRKITRRMIYISDQLEEILKKEINHRWDQNPYSEISPVESSKHPSASNSDFYLR